MTRIARVAAMAALLGGIAAAGIAAAQDAPDGRRPRRPRAPRRWPPMGGPMAMMGFGPGRIDFVAIDTDGNGSLSRAELVARATERLAERRRQRRRHARPAPRSSTRCPAARRLLDLFGADPAEAFADRMLALMGATEAGQVTVADLAGQRVNFLLAFADTDRDAAISQAEADAMRQPPRAARMDAAPRRTGPADRGGPDRTAPTAAGPRVTAAARALTLGRAPRFRQETAARGRAIVSAMRTSLRRRIRGRRAAVRRRASSRSMPRGTRRPRGR